MDDIHFNKVFYFICGITVLVMLFDIAVIFVPVPANGTKYADILVGALNTGTLMAGVQYLLGGSPKRPETAVTGDTPTVNVNTDAK
jgi:hypothetical protein